MPVPLTTAMLLAAFVLVIADDAVLDTVAVVMVALGVINQLLATWATSTTPPRPPEEY